GNRSPEHSRPYAGSTRRKVRLSARPSRPSSLFRCAFLRFSSRVVGGKAGRRINRAVSVSDRGFAENGDEHRRNVLQKIFGRGAGKICGVLAQLVCYLINNESATGREGLVCLLKQVAFFFLLQNAERNSRDDVIALHDAALD